MRALCTLEHACDVTLVFRSQEEENWARDQQEAGLELLAALLTSAIWGPAYLVNWI